MDPDRLGGLLENIGRIKDLSQALRRQAGDFPALERNCLRMLASLKMMEIALGLVTVPKAPPLPQRQEVDDAATAL